MYLYVVTSFRSYCCGNEEYFGADEIFTSRTALHTTVLQMQKLLCTATT